jgi:hypothetical protein
MPGILRDQGLIEAIGKRDRRTVWGAIPIKNKPDAPTQKDAIRQRKIERVINDLMDPEFRAEVQRELEGLKGTREAEKVLRAAERELEAARLDEERREAEAEKTRLKMVEITRNQASQSIKTWEIFIAEIRATRTILMTYAQMYDDLPPVRAAFVRTFDRELQALRQQLEWFDNKLRHRHNGGISRGSVIDV